MKILRNEERIEHDDINITGGNGSFVWNVEHGGELIELTLNYVTLSEKKRYQEKDWLRREYLVNKRSMASIAKQCGVTPMTIWLWLDRFSIETRSRGQKKSS
mgnify:CR=1 FL=1|tara:strand:+ start:14017 stop:14322 length:306 start_codon:yes stop_codon:yes gene_type:complete